MVQVEGPDTTQNIPITRLSQCITSESMEVSDLKPSTEYSFNVSAVTVVGSGPAIGVSFVMPQGGEL